MKCLERKSRVLGLDLQKILSYIRITSPIFLGLCFFDIFEEHHFSDNFDITGKYSTKENEITVFAKKQIMMVNIPTTKFGLHKHDGEFRKSVLAERTTNYPLARIMQNNSDLLGRQKMNTRQQRD